MEVTWRSDANGCHMRNHYDIRLRSPTAVFLGEVLRKKLYQNHMDMGEVNLALAGESIQDKPHAPMLNFHMPLYKSVLAKLMKLAGKRRYRQGCLEN